MRSPETVLKNKDLLRATAALKLKKQLTKMKVSSSVVHENVLDTAEEDLFRLTFENAQVGIAHIGLDGRWIRVNKTFCEIAGWPEKELLGKEFLEIVHPDDQAKDLELVAKVLKEPGTRATMEKRYIRKDGSFRWVRASGTLIRDSVGNPLYGVAVIVDIHEEKNLVEKLELLAKAGNVLGGSLDYRETLSSVANLIVPQLADVCIVDILNKDKTYERVKVAYADPNDKKNVDIFYKYPPTLKTKSLTEQAVSSGKSILIRQVNKERYRDYARSKDHLKAIENFDVKSLMTIPLKARGRKIGAISFFSKQLYRKYTVVDLAFAEQIASRAALAVDNAHLYAHAQKAVSIRDTFLSITSHELKTSLTTIKALAQLLQRELYRAKVKNIHMDFLTKIDSQLNRSTKLINDLLDISKIQSGRISLKKEWIDIDMLVRETADFCCQLSSFHEIKVLGKAGKKVFADRDRISQVITNLISNAIKYAPDTKDILVKLASTPENVVISVQDFGIGIEEDKKKKIFERFFRALGTSREKAGGLGLGLYIANELVRQHGGSISVESEVNKGATFTIILPIAPPVDASIH